MCYLACCNKFSWYEKNVSFWIFLKQFCFNNDLNAFKLCAISSKETTKNPNYFFNNLLELLWWDFTRCGFFPWWLVTCSSTKNCWTRINCIIYVHGHGVCKFYLEKGSSYCDNTFEYTYYNPLKYLFTVLTYLKFTYIKSNLK